MDLPVHAPVPGPCVPCLLWYNVDTMGVYVMGASTMPRPRLYATPAAKKAAYRQRVKIRQRQEAHRRSQEWRTPPEVFAQYARIFPFTLDVAALPDNALCPTFYTPEQDGLQQPWEGVCWCNPPYDRTIAQWIQKAWESAQAGATVVCLLPVRTSTRWWHTYIHEQPGVTTTLLEKRLKYSGHRTNARFDSAIVVFRPPSEAAAVTGD